MTYEELKNSAEYAYLFELAHEASPKYPIYWGLGTGEGWHKPLIFMIMTIGDQDKNDQVRIYQIKSKFGELRVHIRNSTPEIQMIINIYTTICKGLCENCGAPATKKNSGWIMHVCDECYQENR